MGLGVYKNMNVIDGFAAMVLPDRQLNVRTSRQLQPDLDMMSIGPLAYEVVEPFKALRLTLAPGEHPLAFDLMWRGAFTPFLEDATLSRVNGRITTQVSRYDQTGSVEGWIEADGEHINVTDWWGGRDHSWGVRGGVGGFEPHNGPNVYADRGFLITWLIFSTDEMTGYVQVNEDGDGNLTKLEGLLRWAPDQKRPDLRILEVKQDVTFPEGSRSYARATLTLKTEDGKSWEVACEKLMPPAIMRGTGYDNGYNDGKGLGVYRGASHVEWDTYDTTDESVVRLLPGGTEVQSMQREQIVSVSVNGKQGYGDLTILPYGEIKRFGLPALSDAEQALLKKNEAES